jgi:hypothetical protein
MLLVGAEGHSALFIRTQHSRQGGKQGWNLESNCCEIGSTLVTFYYLCFIYILDSHMDTKLFDYEYRTDVT